MQVQALDGGAAKRLVSKVIFGVLFRDPGKGDVLHLKGSLVVADI